MKKFRLRNKIHKGPNCFEGIYKKHHIWIDRERGENFNITVRDFTGDYAYNGYWRDSADKTIDEAIEEALRGSLLLPD